LLNDSYEPEQAVKNAKLLIDYYNVLAIVGVFGTPTTISILEHAIGERPIPLIGPYTASMSIRRQFNPYLITTNPGFSMEFDLVTENLLQNSFHNISILYQDDMYGHIFYTSYVNYIIKNNLHINIVSTGKYERNSDDLENTMRTLFGNNHPYDYASYKKEDTNKAQAIMVFSAEKEISSILGIIKTISPKMAVYYNSFVGNDKKNIEYLDDKDKTNVYQTLSTHTNLDEYPQMKKILMDELRDHNEKDIRMEHTTTSSLIQGFYSGLMIGKVLQNFKNMRELNRKTFLDMFYAMRTINVYGLEMGPFVAQENNEAIRYAELNQLQPNMTFKTIKTIQL
jgi:ABC-type branched-subunit amino acid transport system substrate-binding protein